jgi:hypothetical protein
MDARSVRQLRNALRSRDHPLGLQAGEPQDAALVDAHEAGWEIADLAPLRLQGIAAGGMPNARLGYPRKPPSDVLSLCRSGRPEGRPRQSSPAREKRAIGRHKNQSPAAIDW